MNHLAFYIQPHEKLTLIGYCIGGKICMKLASMYPGIFDELILLESPAGESAYEPASIVEECMNDL